MAILIPVWLQFLAGDAALAAALHHLAAHHLHVMTLAQWTRAHTGR